MANIVAIVGRPNVGKSTLFNRLIEKKQAIMDDQPGVTRDRHYGFGHWTDKYFTVIDTGGYVTGSADQFEGEIRKQVKAAMEEASVIVFMVDSHVGMTDLDMEFANIVRETKKPVVVVANKADTLEYQLMANEFYALSLSDELYPISANSGSGTGDLLDHIVSFFEEQGTENPHEGIPRIAILGRPNAGKSSFLNTITGNERSIVNEEAGTTRDAVDTHYKMFGQNFILTDTAGIRKKSRVKENIEFYSVMRSIQSLQDSDVCIVMVDATRGLEAQDISIINLAVKYGKGVMIMINKWDLIENKVSNTAKDYSDRIYERIGDRRYIPIIYTSVSEKQRIFQAMELAVKIFENKNRRIPTSKLNDILLHEIEKTPPPATKGKYIKIKYITQLPSKTPSIAFFCNLPQYIKAPYQRFLENRIRENFDFTGVPLKIFFRKK
ncbi:ribosome biogenesis GTPase Der [Marinigracilibium pacificum]|uniref:GTPase Der n=1 Tax=Marinigracilibium pacificum TaxID=2729599 RepID=A0A848J5B7_9BACT|nr:ribosome biogenesis GTPase Der [Marinigracilibium pacificum]NMM49710.1 ribosome biogenesis GTPase Der [Marinigracilibium pacificum]